MVAGVSVCLPFLDLRPYRFGGRLTLNSFLPHDILSLARMAALLAVELIAGFGLQYLDPSRLNRFRSWGLVLAATLIAHWITTGEPAGFRMIALIGALFLGMKAVVGVSARLAGGSPLSIPQWFAFTLAWPGMNPGIFRASPRPRKGWKSFMAQGLLCGLTGAALMAAANPVWRATDSPFAVTVLFFIGSSLLVHYGAFTLSTAFWRKKGLDCAPLFKNPFPSQNLGEFWGQRWNLAFSEMTALAVYRPLKDKLGPSQALFASFALSGIFHEIAISLPVNAGFGLPLAYFLLHFGLVALERLCAQRGILFRGMFGRLWVYFWLIVPLPILFHQPFLKGVVWPLIGVTP